jgi:prepilin-type N-terminal cleavage/methylation domain-containing protein
MAADRAGFSLVEVLVALAITTSVVAVACGLAVQAQYAWRADSARTDLQQRARVAADTVRRALLEAGAGPDAGRGKGPMTRFLPPIFPRRTGRRDADLAGVVRTDAFTTIRAVPEMEHAELLLPAVAGASTIEIAATTTCDLPACGFVAGSHALIFDVLGNHDVFTVTDVAGQVLTLRHHGNGAHPGYPEGSPVVAVDQSTYFLDRDAHVLRTYDGDVVLLPIVDDVVGMEVGYFGDVRPPVQPRPAAGTSNCLYESDGTYRATLLPVLSGTGASQAPLTPDILTDGPWCGSGPNRFDADLLRVRTVRVALRLQAGEASVRGTESRRFLVPGHARQSAVQVPDTVVVIDVAPRNLRTTW